MVASNPLELLSTYNVSRESLTNLERYVDLLLNWQQTINLIGPSTVQSVWNRHILDSVQLLPLLPPNCRTLADLGSGAGIPGLVVTIAGQLDVHVYESNSKKVAFLREAARQTGAKIHIHQIRIEDLKASSTIPAVDVILARALAPLPLLLEYAEPFMKRGATALFHKGQDVDLELTEATKYWKLQFSKHQSVCDSRGVILEVKEAMRV